MPRWKKAAILVACFVVPAGCYYLLWLATAQDTLTRLGYYLWLYASPEDLMNKIRLDRIRVVFFGVLMPGLVGLVGLIWGRHWLRRHRHSAPAEPMAPGSPSDKP